MQKTFFSLPLLQGEVARRNDVTEGISANFKANKTLFFDNLSVSFADSSLAREPKGFIKI